MSSNKPDFPSIPENERTPLIDMLLELIQWQEQRISDLEDEIQDLKKETKIPKFKSRKMDKKQRMKTQKVKKRRKKKQNLELHNEKIIQPDNIPEDARFKRYQDIIVVQDIVITPRNTRYRLAQYIQTDDTKARHAGKNGYTYWQ
jgi:uncharacterized protein (DUF342 family)